MPVMTGEFTDWRKSGHSGQGNCVEVGRGPAGIGIRDSKAPDGVVLTFRGETWGQFTAGIKADALAVR